MPSQLKPVDYVSSTSRFGHFHPDTSVPVGSRPDPNTRFPRGTLLLLSASIRSPQPSSPQELYQLAPYDKAQVRARLKQGGFSLSTEQYDLVPGPWPISHPANAPGHVLREFDPTDHEIAVLLNEGQWIHKPDHRDPLPDTVGLIPLIVHKSHYYPATSKDPNTWRRQQDENQSSPKGLTGYLLDPDLFQLVARGFRLQLPNIPFHAAHWRQPSCLRFQLHLASVMRVGQLQSLAAWRSLINPSPSKLHLCWGLTNLGLPMPHDLPTHDFGQSARALLWLLLEQGTSTITEREQGGPANAAPPFGETPEAQTLSALIDSTLASRDNVSAALLKHSLQSTQDYHLLVMVIGTLLSITTQKSELIVRGVFGAGKTMCIALLASWFALPKTLSILCLS